MLSFMVLLTLALHPCLSVADKKKLLGPCAEVGNEKQFQTFLDHHLRKGTPNSLKIGEWQSFINKIDTWDRPIQSFFPIKEYNNAIGVCSTGGKIYGGRNLCISKKPLKFFDVTINEKKQVMDVKFRTDYVILGCNKINNKCLPIHFEANENGATPDNNKPNCS
ncbi:hypothetical protein ABG768_021928 [Culter alburnus]|uniref:Uncharacterized protein n=1 Tax=Culter alburnus TaxID=194366 RepID=A0AAW2AUB8_CULAL